MTDGPCNVPLQRRVEQLRVIADWRQTHAPQAAGPQRVSQQPPQRGDRIDATVGAKHEGK